MVLEELFQPTSGKSHLVNPVNYPPEVGYQKHPKRKPSYYPESIHPPPPPPLTALLQGLQP